MNILNKAQENNPYGEHVNRWEWVDHAKGIGIVLVVYGHVARGLLKAGLPGNKSIFSTIDKIIYSFHMPLFFFLAGLFVFHSLRKRGSAFFIANKIDVILYPYIIWSLGQGIIEVFLASYTNYHIKLGIILSLWVPRAQFWFLYSLMGMFILSAVVYRMFKNEKQFELVLLIIGIIIVPLSWGRQIWGIQHIALLIYFAIGCVAASNLQWRKIIQGRIMLLFSFVTFLIVEYFLCSLSNTALYWVIPVKLAAAFAGIFLCLKIESLTRNRIRNIIIRLGEASLFIYLSHVIVGSGIRIILQKVFRMDNILLHLFLETLAGIVIPLLVYEFYGKSEFVQCLLRTPEIFSIEKIAAAMSKDRRN